jgi:hypothetical protein
VPDDDDRPRDASGAADVSGLGDTSWAEATAPDDIRELERDVQAYRREQRAARRRARLRRLTARPSAVPLLLTGAALAVAALVATLLTVLDPHPTGDTPTPLPVAATSIADGHTGGLLPAASLRATDGSTTSARNLRPGVVAMIPLHCGCEPMLSDLAHAVAGDRFSMYVVAPTYPDAEAAALTGRLDAAGSAVYFDPTGALASSVGADQQVTLAVVDRNGTIFQIERDVTGPNSTLDAALLRMLLQETGD